ncbi:hypothetical protein SCUCBS95973_009361 [Sporothrix curviconia]|uniref:Uncharacterized protein n=1 Tax=Sporothrix curviconia TaxID=1260050 RepID=A0ABP0CUL7_9PEZI
MTVPSTALVVALALLVADATIELGFITSMVAYLHAGAPSGTFVVNTPPALQAATADAAPTYLLPGKPVHVVINEGHASNGAAGSALVLIGVVGTVALVLRHRAPGSRWGRALYYVWMLGLQVPTLLLTLVALAYTMSAVRAHRGQTIDQAVAYANSNANSNANTTQPAPYAVDSWTPQNWFAAVLQLDLADAGLRSNLAMHLRIMRGWQYNLIALFVVQLLETVVAFVDFRAWREMRASGGRSSHGSSAVPTGNEKYYSGNGDNGSGGISGGYHAQYAPQQQQQQQHYGQV